MEHRLIQAIFPLGRTVITANAAERLHPADIEIALQRHAGGAWGEVCDDDAALNNDSVKNGERVHSVYRDRNEITFWIITEADRSATTVLLPEDY